MTAESEIGYLFSMTKLIRATGPKPVKVGQMISICLDLREAMKARAQETRQIMSHVYEDAIRAYLQRPAPEAGPEAAHETALMARVLLALAKPEHAARFEDGLAGWHSSQTLADVCGAPHTAIENACKGMALDGRIFAWGRGSGEPKPENYLVGPNETRWGLRPAVDVIRELVEAYAKDDSPLADLVLKICPLITGASEEIQAAAVALVLSAIDLRAAPPGTKERIVGWFTKRTRADEIRAQQAAEREARASPEAAAKREKEAADQRAEAAARVAESDQQLAAARAYDAQARAAAFAARCGECGGVPCVCAEYSDEEEVVS